MIFEPDKGMNFYNAIDACKYDMLKHKRTYQVMLFNDIHITVSYNSNVDDLATIYDLKRKLISNHLTY